MQTSISNRAIRPKPSVHPGDVQVTRRRSPPSKDTQSQSPGYVSPPPALVRPPSSSRARQRVRVIEHVHSDNYSEDTARYRYAQPEWASPQSIIVCDPRYEDPAYSQHQQYPIQPEFVQVHPAGRGSQMVRVEPRREVSMDVDTPSQYEHSPEQSSYTVSRGNGMVSKETYPGGKLPSRIRTATACDRCRKRKAKCTGVRPSTCERCRRLGFDCVYAEPKQVTQKQDKEKNTKASPKRIRKRKQSEVMQLQEHEDEDTEMKDQTVAMSTSPSYGEAPRRHLHGRVDHPRRIQTAYYAPYPLPSPATRMPPLPPPWTYSLSSTREVPNYAQPHSPQARRGIAFLLNEQNLTPPYSEQGSRRPSDSSSDSSYFPATPQEFPGSSGSRGTQFSAINPTVTPVSLPVMIAAQQMMDSVPRPLFGRFMAPPGLAISRTPSASSTHSQVSSASGVNRNGGQAGNVKSQSRVGDNAVVVLVNAEFVGSTRKEGLDTNAGVVTTAITGNSSYFPAHLASFREPANLNISRAPSTESSYSSEYSWMSRSNESSVPHTPLEWEERRRLHTSPFALELENNLIQLMTETGVEDPFAPDSNDDDTLFKQFLVDEPLPSVEKLSKQMDPVSSNQVDPATASSISGEASCANQSDIGITLSKPLPTLPEFTFTYPLSRVSLRHGSAAVVSCSGAEASKPNSQNKSSSRAKAFAMKPQPDKTVDAGPSRCPQRTTFSTPSVSKSQIMKINHPQENNGSSVPLPASFSWIDFLQTPKTESLFTPDLSSFTAPDTHNELSKMFNVIQATTKPNLNISPRPKANGEVAGLKLTGFVDFGFLAMAAAAQPTIPDDSDSMVEEKTRPIIVHGAKTDRNPGDTKKINSLTSRNRAGPDTDSEEESEELLPSESMLHLLDDMVDELDDA
ncbi:hypothetical protein ABKN59_003992 [Abortiporus biennis]